MVPAHPPFPSCSYLPFQPLAGSHTADLISESLLGRIVNFTSQCAGTVIAAAFAGPPGPAGPANGPAAIVAADVTVAPESFRVVRLSQDCWAKTVEAEVANVKANANRNVRFDKETSLKPFVQR